MDRHEQPTQPLESSPGKPGSMAPSVDASSNSSKPSGGLSRRKLLLGAAAGVGGIALTGSLVVGAVEIVRDRQSGGPRWNGLCGRAGADRAPHASRWFWHRSH